MASKLQWRAAAGLTLALLGSTAPAQQTGQDTVAPPKGARYVLPDGTIRIVGARSMEGIIGKLNALFMQMHPGLRFRFEQADNNGSIDALVFEASAVAPMATLYGGGVAYSDIVKAPPFPLRIAHGSLHPEAGVSPLAVIVNPANPVDKLTLAEVASMFSKPLRARVYSQWNQLGLTGAAADRPVLPAGLPWSDHYASEDRAFADDVFFRLFAAAAPVDTYRMFRTYAEVTDYVAREPAAIGIVQLNKVGPGVKVVPLADGPFARLRRGSAEEIASGHYPLDRFLYLYPRVQIGKTLDPLVRAYLMMALSPQGQAAIAQEGEGYIPLNATELAEEQAKFQ